MKRHWKAGTLALGMVSALAAEGLFFRAAAAQGAPDPGVRSRVEALVERELRLESAHLWRSAIDVCEQILQLDPGNVETVNTLAGLHGTLGEGQEEVDWAQKALALDPLYPPAYLNQGTGLALLGRDEEAQAAYEKARQLAPDAPLPLFHLGVLAEKHGDIESALAYYDRAVALDESFASGHFNRAAMLANLKRYDEAVAALHTVLELEPGSADAGEMLRAIERERPAAPRPASLAQAGNTRQAP